MVCHSFDAIFNAVFLNNDIHQRGYWSYYSKLVVDSRKTHYNSTMTLGRQNTSSSQTCPPLSA